MAENSARTRRTGRSVTAAPTLNSSDKSEGRRRREVEDTNSETSTPKSSTGAPLKLTRNALIARMKELEVHNERRWWRAPIPGLGKEPFPKITKRLGRM